MKSCQFHQFVNRGFALPECREMQSKSDASALAQYLML